VNLDQTVSVAPSVIFQEVAGEMVILDLESESYFGLDAVGTRIWQLIDEHGDLRRIFTTLLAEYEVEEAQLRGDLEALISDAAGRGLITLHSDAGSRGKDSV